MPLKSDISIDAAKFGPDAISEQTKKYNEVLVSRMETAPKWFEVGYAGDIS